MKKFKLLPTILMLVLCVGVLAIGVFALSPTKNTISGTITVNASNPEVKISAYKYGADGNMLETPFIPETAVRSGINLNLGSDLTFDLTAVNTDDELAAKTIKVAIKIVNPTTNSLAAYFSETEMTGALTDTGSIKTQKTLTTEANVNATVKATMTNYSQIAGNNGYVFMILEFSLTDFPTDDTTVDLSKAVNKMYLNIETFNQTIYDSLNAVLIGTSGSALSSSMVLAAANNDLTTLKSVKIADGVTAIDSNAFKDCSNITSVTMPNSVTTIDSGAFQNCTNLKSVVIPETVTSISIAAFMGCSGLESIVVDSNNSTYKSVNNAILTIDGKTLLFGSKKTTIIPDGVTKIEQYAFYGCKDLTSIIIPSTVTVIIETSFSDCSGLESIVVDSNNATYKSVNNAILTIDGTTLVLGCKETIIPSSVTKIEKWAFRGCSGLTSITIPSTVESIGVESFKDCSGLASIILTNGVKEIRMTAFSGCSSLTGVTIPNSVKKFGELFAGPFAVGCNSLEYITIKQGTDFTSGKYDLPTLTKEGETFKGWYTNAEGTGDPVKKLSADAYAQDTTYYAIWQ